MIRIGRVPSELVVPWGNGEDARVEVLESRTGGRPTASGHGQTSGATIAMLLELARS